jgi:sarcosine oxidase subunit beta
VGLPSSAEVVVVGGGVVGTSVAFHLAEAGVPDVLLLERDSIASGSSSRGAGGVRAHFSDPVNVALGRRSLELFEAFGERPGADIALERTGYLFLLSRSEDVRAFEEAVELQNGLGIPSRMLGPEEARALNPLVEVGDVLAASLCPLGGHASPPRVAEGYAAGARRHGARVETGCAVEGLGSSARGELRRVLTSRGAVATGTLVCAAGAWSRGVAGLAGVSLPVTPEPRRVLLTEPVPGTPDGMPFTIDAASLLYFRRHGNGLLVGIRDTGAGQAEGTWWPSLREAAERRAPAVARAQATGGWTGLYEATPDANALIGEAPEPRRFLYATGFSGHGFLQSPAAGETLRDLVLGRAPAIDVGPLSAERFAGADRPERHVV